jgi:hypothetical protein
MGVQLKLSPQVKRLILPALLMLLMANAALPQESEKPKTEIKVFGFVGYDAILDTYKSLDTRDGELIFYPLRPRLDSAGKDINRVIQLQMLSICTRVGISVKGPDVLGAKSSALVETDFYATKNDYVSLLRIRHAMLRLKWATAELLVGQYWHPVFVTDVAPSVISFGSGAPFHSLNRSPQIRFSCYPTPMLRITLAALMQGYHKSAGPDDAQRNSGKPELMLQAAAGSPESFLAGLSAGYKWLTPRLITQTGYATDKTSGQYLFSIFLLKKIGKTALKAEAIYGQNPTHLNMIGGYGMESGMGIDPSEDYSYASLRTLSTWIDAQHQAGNVGVGVFAGFSRLYGADKNYTGLTGYSRNDDLNYIYRVSPRLSYQAENISLALEYMLTAAIYGNTFDNRHRVTSSLDPVYNHRVTLNIKYTF